MPRASIADLLAFYFPMKLSFSATNPCHVYHVARELYELGHLGRFYSGYPKWKLGDCNGMPVRSHSARTCAVYGALKFLPETLRPQNRTLFLWQDLSFDRWVGKHLEPCDFIHGIPGQCLETFRKAKRLGVQSVLNHATGPVQDWVRILEPEYRRVGLSVPAVTPYDDAYFKREAEEYGLADYHCVASSIVRDQLRNRGISSEKIWVVPYGADEKLFFPRTEGRLSDSDHSVLERAGSAKSSPFRIVFAGQLALRKGVRLLLAALELAGKRDWEVNFYGATLRETERDRKAYKGTIPLNFHGPVPQNRLAEILRSSSLLVLPSLEEGFGLVVVQALACGLPCVVSDAVGAKDLIQHRVNGSIFPSGNTAALKEELEFWENRRVSLEGDYGWASSAKALLQFSGRALTSLS